MAPQKLETSEQITAETLIVEFLEAHDDALKQRIDALEDLESIYEFYKERDPKLTLKQLKGWLYYREQDFVAHVLGRLATILDGVQEDSVFTINASLLFDIDGTFFGDLSNTKSNIRPAATLLLAYIQNRFPQIQMGIVSSRGQSGIEEKCADRWTPGSLAKAARYMTVPPLGVHNIRPGIQINEENFDPRFYPEWEPYTGLEALLVSQMGFDPKQAEQIAKVEIPLLGEINKKTAIVTWEQFEIEKAMGIVEETPDSEEAKFFEVLLFEVLMKREGLIQAIKGGRSQQIICEETARAILERHQESIAPDQWDMYQKALVAGLHCFWEGLKAQINHGDLERIPRFLQQTDLHNTLGLKHDPERAFGMVLEHFLEEALQSHPDAILLPNPELKDQIYDTWSSFHQRNRKHAQKIDNNIAQILNVHPVFVHVALQRLAAGWRRLEEGKASVAIVIDNEQIAEKLDQLFQGNIKNEEGNPIDAHTLLGIPEEYRGRLWIIHTGKDAEYTIKAMRARIAQNLIFQSLFDSQ